MSCLGTIALLLLALLATKSEAKIDFDTEIVPILSKAGCNAAACHGGSAGRGGFRLSLFGGDPSLDYRMIVNELEGRRVDLVRPSESLFLAKPTGQLEHGGGQLLDLDGPAVHAIESWIASGAPRLRQRQLVDLSVTPLEVSSDALPLEIPLNVHAVFDDGTIRDVSDLAVYTSQSKTALSISDGGLLRVTKPGRQSALVRFGNQIRTVLITTPLGSTLLDKADYPRDNWIDDEVADVLQALRLAAAPATSDAGYLRRVTLDLCGRLPGGTEIRDYLEDASNDKRQRLVDRLLASDEFTEYWTHRLAGMLRLRVPATDRLATERFYQWLAEHVRQDSGWQVMTSALICSEGDTHLHGAATFHRFFATAREQAEYVSEVFMGVRMRCANCHNHPLDRWTQDDYHGLAQIFAGVQRGQVITFSKRGEVMHPRTGEVAIARIPGVDFVDAEDTRPALSDWLTAEDNPYLARAFAGRVWQALMGRGLVSPVDDLRATNPASHPRLLERLADYFQAEGFRIRPLVRVICLSAAYARSSTPVPGQPRDDSFYSHALQKPLAAEVLADAIANVTGVHSDYGGHAPRRAISVIDRRQASGELQFLGQCLPDEGCPADATASSRGIASKLHLMNGALLNRKIIDPAGRLATLLDQQADTRGIVSEFILRALSRPATAAERNRWVEEIDAVETAERKARCEDFLWALLNCHEFTTNH